MKLSRWNEASLMIGTLLGIGAIAACSSVTEVDATSSSADASSTNGAGGTSSTNGAGGTSSGNGGGCPAPNFLDVTQFDGAGSNFPAPELNVTCEGEEVVVRGNGIPHYTFVATTPNQLATQDHEFRFPLNPSYQETTTDIALLGSVGVAVNGLPFYGPNEGAFPDPFGDPVFNGIMDDCQGHTAMAGDYHYHALLVECLTQDSKPTQPSPIIGYAFDGFPIYGPYGCVDAECSTVVEFKSSWDRTGDPTTYAWDNHSCTKETCNNPSGEYLDRCNGRFGPNGDYRYHATLPYKEDDYTGFPYILGCYHGAAENVGAGAGPNGAGPNGAGPNGAGPNGAGPTGGGMNPPNCAPGQTMMCCGDGNCDGPETAQNCPADCN